MIRALAFCAVVSAVSAASAQNAAPLKYAPEAGEPTVALAEDAPISACGKQECPAPKGETVSDKPIDDHALLRQKLAEMNCLQSEIDALRVATRTPQAVLVKIKVVEVSRTALRNVGIDFDEMISNGQMDKEQLDLLLDNNVAKVLAEPNIATTCGRPASLIVGGEEPMPAAPGSKQAVEFKRFGTEVDLLAIAQGENRIRLEVRARVSEVDSARANEVAGKRVPGFSVRQVDTAFESEIGHTVALSGHVQRRVEARKVSSNKVINVDHDIELLFLVTTEPIVLKPHGDAVTGAPYRTANSASEPDPAERSLRVSKPYTPR